MLPSLHAYADDPSPQSAPPSLYGTGPAATNSVRSVPWGLAQAKPIIPLLSAVFAAVVAAAASLPPCTHARPTTSAAAASVRFNAPCYNDYAAARTSAKSVGQKKTSISNIAAAGCNLTEAI